MCFAISSGNKNKRIGTDHTATASQYEAVVELEGVIIAGEILILCQHVHLLVRSPRPRALEGDDYHPRRFREAHVS